MLTLDQVKIVERVLQMFTPLPKVRLDSNVMNAGTSAIMVDEAIVVDEEGYVGLFSISETTVEVNSILGVSQVPGFLLQAVAVGPGNGHDIEYDVDIVEVATDRSFEDLVMTLCVEIAHYRAVMVLGDIADDEAAKSYS